ncbi:MAG TPA: ABC transporter ATP-binding protein [Fimbriimonadaceae bacterium]|nr:ABC transporter ATP-binding protein [Fimbriimonadaceae bacterium]
MNVAEIHGLTVRYGAFTALNNLSVSIPEGCIGLLGPNGAGKTTLLKTILGFVDPAAGGGKVLGFDIATQGKQIRQQIGLMPEQDCHIPGMTAVTFVAYAGELAGMPKEHALRRAHEVLEYCGLGEARYRNVETYSTGMKQRIKFAQALVHGPKLLLLDEPTNGLDPRGRDEMLDLVRSVSHGKGVNVIVSSHLLPDIERTCDEVVLVMNGQLRASGLISELKKIEGHPYDVELREPCPGFADIAVKNGGELLDSRSNTYRIIAPGVREDAVKFLLKCANEAKVQVRGLIPAERSLEDVFLNAISDKPTFDIPGAEK